MDQKAILDHQFLVIAFCVTWTLQLGYVLRIVLKWRAEKRIAERFSGDSR